MCEELVKRLRDAAKMSEALAVLLPHSEGNATAKLYNEAADAIEELERHYCRHAIHNEHDRGDDSPRDKYKCEVNALPKWIPVTEALPSDFVSVQAHMTDAGDFPSVREAYVVDEGWFFPSLKEFHPVDMWKRFDEPPKEET